MEFVGVCHIEGMGVVQNHAEAIIWLQRSVDNGHMHSFELMGCLFENRKSALQNHVKAHMCYNLASAAGYQSAAVRRDKLSGMTTAQIARVRQLSSAWKPGMDIARM